MYQLTEGEFEPWLNKEAIKSQPSKKQQEGDVFNG
jgi:hypothetical protein